MTRTGSWVKCLPSTTEGSAKTSPPQCRVIGSLKGDSIMRRGPGSSTSRWGAVIVTALLLSLLEPPSWSHAESILVLGGTGCPGPSCVTIQQYSLSGNNLGVFASGLINTGWITADDRGNVYLSEYHDGGPIRKFSPVGVEVLTTPTTFTPAGIAIGSDRSIYVAHYDGGKVQHYSASGDDLGVFASPRRGRDRFYSV